ncbi:uncharacterized protein LOC130051548 [Ostrea edulis]|uniref:uncharacterized protein LOC130051548 n=1 Tax=Ostrea edulis TaxID=37623 RepID=UPI0024AEE3FA|nr:uncharacterized protein LOC130051548 [Ostrea edulis]
MFEEKYVLLHLQEFKNIARLSYVRFNCTELKAASIEVSTGNNQRYVKLSRFCITAKERSFYTFKVKATNDAHIALMSADDDTKPLYEIVLGGWGNSKSCLRTRKQSSCKSTHQGGVVSGTTYKSFWVSWINSRITVGLEDIVDQNAVMEYYHATPYSVNFFAVMTGWGSTGHWIFKNDVSCNLETYNNTGIVENNTECHGTTKYECDVGYYLHTGNLQRTCSLNKKWLEEPPICKRCMCPCSLTGQQTINSTRELEEKITQIKKELKVNKKSTNAFLRKKISAPDFRPSSVRIGYICGYGILISVVSVILISDVPRLYRHIWFGID